MSFPTYGHIQPEPAPRRLDLGKLNSRQREAVLHGEGPMLVLAGAGSGKTSTMAYRIAHLVAERKQPGSSILGMSFTKKAAEELKERVKKLVSEASGPKACRGLTITTFHSLCVRILRAHAEKLGFSKNFTIMDQPDQVDLIRGILKNIKVDERRFDPDTILFEIGQAKNRFLSPEKAQDFFFGSGRMPSDYAEVTASAFTKYRDQLRALDAMDFDDLIFNAVSLLETSNEARDGYNLLFKHILVDEYQDTNPAQFRLLELLTEYRQNLCVVGDDDQSIYGWRGADATHILQFTHHFEGAKVVTLDQNYRSTSTILDAANEVISKNTKRHPKRLWSDRGAGEPIQLVIVEEDRAEAEYVAEEILRRARKAHEGVVTQLRPWKDFAVLYRSNPQSRLFEEALRMRQIPYKIVGSMSFLDRKEVKDLLSYWRLVVNPKDDASARRVVNWPARGVGKTALEAVGTHSLATGKSFFEGLADAGTVYPRALSGASAFRSLIEELRRDLEQMPLEPEALANWGKRSLEKIGARKGIEEDCDDPAQAAKRIENCEELCHSIGQMDLVEIASLSLSEEGVQANGVTVLREYLARMTLNAQDDKKDEKDKKDSADQVTLLTLHGAKGLEYPIVFLVGMEEGLLPHRRTIEEGLDFSEERRLCYVGVTRARDHLILTRCRNRIRYGKAVPRTPSRFLDEMPKQLFVTDDLSTSPNLDTEEAQEKHEEKVKDFLAQIRSQLGEKKPPGMPRR